MNLLKIRMEYGTINANKLVIKKDRFIVYLEDGEVYQFPFARIVRVGHDTDKHTAIEIELKKSKLKIKIKIARIKPSIGIIVDQI